MMLACSIRKMVREQELEGIRFEQDLFINNPALHSEYMKNKEQELIDSGNDSSIVTDPEQIRKIEEALLLSSQVKRSEKEIEDGKEFVKRMWQNSPFNNIDIDQIGDDE